MTEDGLLIVVGLLVVAASILLGALALVRACGNIVIGA